MQSLAFSFTAKLGTLVACGARAALRAAKGGMRETGVACGAALAVLGAASSLAAQEPNLLLNPGFEQAGCNPGYYTEYLCWPPVDPGRGYFTVGTNPAAWNGLFNNCPTDHTPDGTRMMILDGDTHRVAWAQTVANLEANQTYRFRFWAMNLYNANPAVLKVSFRPEPNWQFTLVPASFQVQIAGCTWQMAEFFWNCNPSFWGAGQPRNMTIVVENTTSGEQGADFALDDMEFKKACWGTPSITSGPPSSVVGGFGGSAAITLSFQSNSDAPMTLPFPPGYGVAWSHGGVPVTGGLTTVVTTGTNAYTTTLTLSNLGLADRGLYTCTITSPCGSVVSSAANLRILGRAR